MSSDPEVADRYLGSTVIGFKNGSIVADYIVHLADTNTESTDATAMESAFEDALMRSMNAGSVNMTVDVAASTVIGKWEVCFSYHTNWEIRVAKRYLLDWGKIVCN